jgi:hypothetical protein
VYPVIADPPLFAGAVNEITTLSLPEATELTVGAFGTVDGVAGNDALDATPVPMPFVAVTLKVYATPFVRLLIKQLCVGAVLVQLPATVFSGVYAVAVYPVTAEPLMLAGASQETVAEETAATAVTLSGADGGALIAAAGDALDAVEVPAALVAVALNV